MPQYPYESYEPPQYQNAYQSPPFGHARDEGTIQETIHRTVNKRLDRSSTRPGHRSGSPSGLTGELYSDIYQALPVAERGAWLTSHEFVVHATKKQVSVIQGDVRGTAHLG